MVEFCNGNLLESKCDLIAHQTNTMGVMGTGLALQIKNKYPKVFVDYKTYCRTNSVSLLGTIQVCIIGERKYLANCFSQIKWNTEYCLVESVAEQLLKFALDFNLSSVGIPYEFGCILTDGDWERVVDIFTRVFQDEKRVVLKIYKLND